MAEARDQVRSAGDIASHAELTAIRLACDALRTLDLKGCTLYTNVEPCWMCSFAIREANIGEVVIEKPVDGIGGLTSQYPILSDGDIEGWSEPPSIVWIESDTEQQCDTSMGIMADAP